MLVLHILQEDSRPLLPYCWMGARVQVKETPAASGLGPRLSESEREALAAHLEQALFAAKVCAYAQGFSVIRAASDEYKWDVQLADLAKIWRGGCALILPRSLRSMDVRLQPLLILGTFTGSQMRGWRFHILAGMIPPEMKSPLDA